MKNILLLLLLSMGAIGCISTKQTIRNINKNASEPVLSAQNYYILTEVATEKKYGYDKRYPINVGFGTTVKREANIQKFLSALKGPNGEVISFEHQGSCCPFPTENSQLGGGMLEYYRINWEGNQKEIVLYFNYFDKGNLYIPIGFTAKK